MKHLLDMEPDLRRLRALAELLELAGEGLEADHQTDTAMAVRHAGELVAETARRLRETFNRATDALRREADARAFAAMRTPGEASS
ncbi:hypothetical protein [Blastochloris sulfoviridis]|nr:hypothetical protein [Blastochloris sulfoviridis]